MVLWLIIGVGVTLLAGFLGYKGYKTGKAGRRKG